MKRTKDDTNTDLEVCRDKIELILTEYNCVIESDDWHSAWLRDEDTNVTVGFKRR